ncbi:holo-ACP synthase [Lacrimispora sp. 210928-DFI.3.58]|uniref:holo-ACP synthase n=1 Tax=Lacrimispora sp. 210928-DFI.3.58 TaxID=2883214 RepID=UPI0015B54313|nr:holo-ACP synthase [Lacrimispora sp. 210928-DFI.3.58]MCB7317812.1 holo-ACP synthase [Lacrimispora sp. 210928-DFI.3.58]
MILGVGTDLVEIDRIRKACEKDYFVVRTFTEMESRQAKGSASKLAGSFAVKEAVAKVLGTGFRTFMPIDVEVLRDELGKPYVRLYGGALVRFQEMGMERIEVSISNTGEYAMAFAVGEGGERGGMP